MTRQETSATDGTGEPRSFHPATVTAIASIVVILWMGLGWDVIKRPSTYRGKKGDYYSLLVHGFLSGHVYMDLVPDPGLESPDPAVRDRCFAPLDASYYKRHFYLYFGVTPAALFLLPYSWATGGDLDPRVVVDLCVVAGFLFAIGTWRMAAKDHFPGVGWVVQVASIAILAFATATPLLITRAMFYEMAIAAGYTFVTGGCFWMYRALFARGRTWLQLAWASLFFGLAVGCRPDLLMDLPALAAAALIAAVWSSQGRSRSRAMILNGAAAIIPAAVAGCLLALYNYERFGSPVEFGFRYGLNNFIANHLRLASPTYVWPNLHWYYLTLPAIGPYFPFVFPCRAEFGPAGYETGEMIHGQFLVFILAAFVAISALVLGRTIHLGRMAAYIGALVFMFVAVLIVLSPLGIRADRYMVDFQAPLVLAVALVAGLVASRVGVGRSSGPWGATFIVLALAGVAFNFFAGLEEFDAFKNMRTPVFTYLESIGNAPSTWLARLGLLRYGPVELKVVFPDNVTHLTAEPLLTLGTPQYSDSVYVNEYPGNRIQFIGSHPRYVQPLSDLITVTPGKVYTLKVEMGALYPPLDNPLFSAYSAFQSRRMKSGVNVTLDGETVFDARMGSYNAPPWTLEVGRNDISMFPGTMSFSGKIIAMRRLTIPPPQADEKFNGVRRILCIFPMKMLGSNFPVLSWGVNGNGTLVYVSILPEGRIRFGVDEWGYGSGNSEPVSVEPFAEHTIEIFIGTLASQADWPKDWHIGAGQVDGSRSKLRIWLDGKLVQEYGLHAPYNPLADLVDIGVNIQGFSTSLTEFDGPIRPDPYSDPELREFVNRNLAPRQ
jgi:hypothetical protein